MVLKIIELFTYRAIDENKESLATFLIRSGCDVECARRAAAGGEGAELAAERHTPLHLCCTWGLSDVIQVPGQHNLVR